MRRVKGRNIICVGCCLQNFFVSFLASIEIALHPVDCKTRDSWLLRSIILKWHDWRFQIAKQKKKCVFYRRCLLCIQVIYMCVCVCWFGWLVGWSFDCLCWFVCLVWLYDCVCWCFCLVWLNVRLFVCLFDWLFDCLNWQVFLLPSTVHRWPLALRIHLCTGTVSPRPHFKRIAHGQGGCSGCTPGRQMFADGQIGRGYIL